MMKKERNLLKLLTNEECYDAYKKAFSTAEVHRKSAESIAKNGYYGTAVSHLILGTEELTKGLLLLYQQTIHPPILPLIRQIIISVFHILKYPKKFAALV